MTIFVSKFSIAQTNICIDVNNRITYSLPLHSILFVSPVSDNTNYILGGYKEPADTGVVLSKTYFDSILWAKKYKSTEKNLTISNSILLPDSSIVTNSKASTNGPLFLIRFNANGNVLWAKKYTLNIPNSSSNSGNQTNNILKLANNYIYCTREFTDFIQNYLTIIKLDLNGNIIWSRAFNTNSPVSSYFSDPPAINGDTVYIASNIVYNNILASKIDSIAIGITKLNANTGNLISATKYKTSPHNYIKGITVFNSTFSVGNTLNLTGVIGVNYPGYPGGIAPNTGIPFVLHLDKSGNFIDAKYFTYSGVYGIDGPPSFTSSLNNKNQTGFLLTDLFNRLAYTLNIDSNLQVKRTRVFYPNSLLNLASEQSFKLDDREANIFSLSYDNVVQNRTELEYFRINNLAPANSLSCFGIDTSVFQSNSFSIISSSFLWDSQFSNLINSQSFTLNEEPFTLNKQIVCTQISICDTIKIKGGVNHCLTTPVTTFTLYKNPQCLRKTNWLFDTTAVQIISQPNDTTINVKFLKTFHGYIKAGFEGCVLKDSLYIDVNNPKQNLSLGKDTILCLNKTIVLNAGAGFKTYNWQDGSSNQTFTATQTGTYFVTAVDSCNNKFSDTIKVKPMDINLVVDYPEPICLYDTATIFLTSALKNYSWTPLNDGLISAGNTLKLFPKATTLFTVSGERFAGCKLTDTVLIKVVDCPVYIYFPNAFTPNNDGRNDIFKASFSGNVEQFELTVYNRYGELIFTTKSPGYGWDGKIKGAAQNTGVYVWHCQYKMRNESIKFAKGTVTLIR